MTDEVIDDAAVEMMRELVSRWFELCDCNGPQPSLSNPRVDEHAHDCPYRAAVEGEDASR